MENVWLQSSLAGVGRKESKIKLHSLFIRKVWPFRSYQIPVQPTTTEKEWRGHLPAQWTWGSDASEFSHLSKTKYKCYMRPSLSMLLASPWLHPLPCAQFLSWTECMTLKIQSTELHLVIFSGSCYFKAKGSSSSGKYDCVDDMLWNQVPSLSFHWSSRGAFAFNLGTLGLDLGWRGDEHSVVTSLGKCHRNGSAFLFQSCAHLKTLKKAKNKCTVCSQLRKPSRSVFEKALGY